MKKKLLFVINTLGHAGAEVALFELFARLDRNRYEIFLYVILGQGEMFLNLPSDVHILNSLYSTESVLSEAGRKQMQKKCMHALLKKGYRRQNLSYVLKQYRKMKKKGSVQMDKLLWRVLSDSCEQFQEQFDLAVAYLEGGATYYVAEHVNAKKKAAFVHIDYGSSGYSREMDLGCYDKIDRIFTVSDEVKKHFLDFYPGYEDKTEVFHNLIDQDKIRSRAGEEGGFSDGYEGFRILTVGRLNPQKAYEVAIDVMKILREAGVDARWYVLGSERSWKPGYSSLDYSTILSSVERQTIRILITVRRICMYMPPDLKERALPSRKPRRLVVLLWHRIVMETESRLKMVWMAYCVNLMPGRLRQRYRH